MSEQITGHVPDKVELRIDPQDGTPYLRHVYDGVGAGSCLFTTLDRVTPFVPTGDPTHLATEGTAEQIALAALLRLSEGSTDGRLRDAIALVRSALHDQVEGATRAEYVSRFNPRREAITRLAKGLPLRPPAPGGGR